MAGHVADVSVCTIVRGRANHLRNQLRGLAGCDPAPVEMVVVHMGESPGEHNFAGAVPIVEGFVPVREVHGDGLSLPLSAARNEAARLATGGVLVFLDVDCVPSPTLVGDYQDVAQCRGDDLLSGRVRYLEQPIAAGVESSALDALSVEHPNRPHVADAAVEMHPPELFWSLSFAVTCRTFARIGGFDENYVGYGGEDTDFAFRARRAGADHVMVGAATAYHQPHEHHDPPVGHVASIVANARRFHAVWGRWPMQGWLAAFAREGLIRWSPDARDIELITAGSTR